MPESEGKATIFTRTVTAASFTIPDGGVEIFILNSGAGVATLTGSAKDPATGLASTAISLPSNTAYSLGYCGRGRKGFVIDATLTTVLITVTY